MFKLSYLIPVVVLKLKVDNITHREVRMIS